MGLAISNVRKSSAALMHDGAVERLGTPLEPSLRVSADPERLHLFDAASGRRMAA
jgi:hypothetical protein